MKKFLAGLLFATMLICCTQAGFASGPTSTAPPDQYSLSCDHIYTVSMAGDQLSETPVSSNILISTETSTVTMHTEGVQDMIMSITSYEVEAYNDKQVPVCYISDPTYKKLMIDKDDGLVVFIPKEAGGKMLVFKTCELRH